MAFKYKNTSNVDRAWMLFTLRLYNDYWERGVPPSTWQILQDFPDKNRAIFLYRDMLCYYHYIDPNNLKITNKGHKLLRKREQIEADIFVIE